MTRLPTISTLFPYTTLFRSSFTSSHPLVNRLVQNTIWSQRGNFIEVPTDCPQRDERFGWTGDAQVFAPTACYLHDRDRKSTRLNSSHPSISYAVFCLKKNNN